jgi:crotonobetainyl-CoA:carnitine CoA-transferase CaiB-like acyl-CoA transferase
VIHARATSEGQVIDCAMSDGAASLMAMFYGFKAGGMWNEGRRSNLLDGGAHFYDTYQMLATANGSRSARSSRSSICFCLKRPGSPIRNSSTR